MRAFLRYAADRDYITFLVVIFVESSVSFGSTLESMRGCILSLVGTQALGIRTAIFRLHLLMLKAEVPTHGYSLRYHCSRSGPRLNLVRL